jgi:hypothetical protein
MAAQDKKVGLLKRATESAKKQSLDMPEFIGNLPENTVGLAVRYLLKKFGPEKAAKMIEHLEQTAEKLPESQLGELGKKSGFLKNLPQAETYKEKVSENLGKGFIDILSGGVPLKTLSTLPKAISTIGGLLGQAAAQPKIKEKLPDSPVLQMGADIVSGLGGAALGSKLSKSFMKPKPLELPIGTAGQLASLGSEKSDLLLAKQLDLTKKDYKSAKLLQKIQKQQHDEIVRKLTFKNETKGSEIVKAIDQSFENKKRVRSRQYQAEKDKIFNNYKGDAPDLSPVFDLIDQITSEASQGGKITKVLGDINNKIHMNRGSLIHLNSTKSELQALTHGLGKAELHLSDQQAALINMVSHRLEQQIEKAVPKIGKMNELYKAQTEELQKLQKGVVGKSVKSAATKPSEIFKKIFEKTDPEKIAEFKSVIPRGLYEKAAEQYLGDVLQSSLGQPSRNQANLSNKFFNVRKNLEKNRSQLEATLPEKYNNLVSEVIGDIQISERGVPRNDYTIQSNRNVAVGDEAKGLGVAKNYLGKSIPSILGAGAGYMVGGLPGAAVGTAVGTGASQIGNSLKNKALRKEMLTGLSPVQQVTETGAKLSPQIIQQSMLGKSLANESEPSQIPQSETPQSEAPQDEVPMTQPQLPQQLPEQLPAPETLPETPNEEIGGEGEQYGQNNKMDDFFESLGSKEKEGRKERGDISSNNAMDDFFAKLDTNKKTKKK